MLMLKVEAIEPWRYTIVFTVIVTICCSVHLGAKDLPIFSALRLPLTLMVRLRWGAPLASSAR